MINLENIKNYLRVDYDEDDLLIQNIIEQSEAYIDLTCGEGYKTNEKGIRIKELVQKKIIKDMYDNRNTEIPSNTKKDIIVTTSFDVLANMNIYE